MSADQERELDRLLGEHLARTLTPQSGRSGRAFDALIREQERQRHRRWFALASSASLIAASVVLALVLWRSPGASRTRVEKTSPIPINQQQPPRDVEQLIAWQTFDEGVEKIDVQDKAMPVHRLRQEAIQQIEWFDPTDQSKIRLLVPRQDVLLIAQETY